MSAVLATNRVDNLDKKERVAIYFSDYKKQRPNFFPAGREVSRDGKAVTMSYASDMLLLVLWERRLADFSPSMLHAAKRGLLSEYERSLDSMLDVDL